MKNNLVTCLGCGWVSFAVTRRYANAEIAGFKKYYDGLTKKQQKELYGGESSSIAQYEQCFRCGGPYTNFKKAKAEECPTGSTINPVLGRDE